MTAPAEPIDYCPRCGHYADKHAGEQGCIDHTDGNDCFCTRTYAAIVGGTA